MKNATDQIADGVGGLVDGVAYVATFGYTNSSLGKIISGVGGLAKGTIETSGTILNNTSDVSKSQKNFLLS